jgi:membrane-bound serine protease (ClpP class)
MTASPPAFLLWLIAHPNLALILVLAGILLLYAEFNRPGIILFACLGTLCATLGVYALAQHPIEPFSLATLPVAISLIVLRLRFPWKNILLILGAVFLYLSLSHLLQRTPAIWRATAFLVSIVFTGVTVLLGQIALEARRRKRLPNLQVQPLNPTPHPAPPARRVD